jgi:pimeloyl-ACP methyl ester carboxylesterase
VITHVLASLGVLTAGIMLVALHFLFWGWFYRPRLDSDALLTAVTSDGWRLAVAHFVPADRTPGRPPIVLCHGLSVNRLNMMLPGAHSLAGFLRSRGYEVFVCDLRGVGDSRQAPATATARDIDFDRHLYLDAPAILAKALEVSGAPRAFWVGHSMGGLLGLGLAEAEHGAKLAGVVALGSPTHFTYHHDLLKALLRRLMPMLWGATVPQRWAVRLVAPYLVVRRVIGSITLNPRNIDGAMLRRVAYLVLDNVSVALVRQFEGWMRRDAWDTRAPPRDLRAGLRQVTCPVFLIAGSVDVLAPPKAVTETLECLGAADKTLRIEGKAFGAQEEYGHGDLIFGTRAPVEIFPAVLGWLESHQPP